MSAEAKLIRRLGTATRVINTELKKMIIDVDAVDTGRMKNISVVHINWDKNSTKIELEIDSTEYYKYVDQGTKHIKPRDITKKLVKRVKVKDQFEKLGKDLVEYMISEKLGKFSK